MPFLSILVNSPLHYMDIIKLYTRIQIHKGDCCWVRTDKKKIDCKKIKLSYIIWPTYNTCFHKLILKRNKNAWCRNWNVFVSHFLKSSIICCSHSLEVKICLPSLLFRTLNWVLRNAYHRRETPKKVLMDSISRFVSQLCSIMLKQKEKLR